MAKKPIYSEIPVVPKKTIAGTNPMGTVALGGAKSPTVPQKASSIHGLDVPAHTFRTPSIKGAHGYGHVAKMKQGHLRVSGVPGAAKIGTKVKIK